MIKFDKDITLALYKMMAEHTGGTVGIRDEGMLESALEAPFQTFGGYELYPELLEKAARLGYGLVANHPFVDGNKRIGVFVMLVFLEVNGVFVNFSDDVVEDLALGIASGKYQYEDVLQILKKC